MPATPTPVVLVAHRDPAIADAIGQEITATGLWQAQLIPADDRDQLLLALAAAPSAAVIGCDLLASLPPSTTTPLLAIGEPDRPADLHIAINGGAAGLLAWPSGVADLSGELARIARPSPTQPGTPAGSVVVAVAGVHGGAGATTLAVHLAGAWARWGAGPVLLADLAGGLGFRLDLSPTTPTWTALAPAMFSTSAKPDDAGLARILATPWPGLTVLPLAGLPDGAPEQLPSAELVDNLLTAARSSFSTIVVDLPSAQVAAWTASAGRDEAERDRDRAPGEVVLDQADVLVLVARPDSAGMTALETADAARSAAYIPAARTGMVVMGSSSAAPVGGREVRARLADRLWALVPSSAAELAAAAEDGLMLLDRPEVPAVQAMLALAHRILPFTGAVIVR